MELAQAIDRVRTGPQGPQVGAYFVVSALVHNPNLDPPAIAGSLYPEAWQLVQAHRDAGHTIAIVTDAPERPQVTAIADCLTITQVSDNAAPNPGDYSYDDTTATALRFRPRGRNTPYRFTRTIAGFIGLLGGAAVGIVRALPSRDRLAVRNSFIAHATGGAIRGAGVRVRISGAEHLTSPRPAVFLFNHQSQFDVVLVPNLLCPNVTGVAKIEITRNPVFGPLLRFAGVTFLDRSDSARAVGALGPVVDTVKSGISVAIAPEGHRSRTPTVSSFKKGAFHVAMQAGVPVIPVVIRNSGEIQWRDDVIVRPGTIDVTVLPPIDVSAWTPDTLDAHINQVRELYHHTLTHWPG